MLINFVQVKIKNDPNGWPIPDICIYFGAQKFCDGCFAFVTLCLRHFENVLIIFSSQFKKSLDWCNLNWEDNWLVQTIAVFKFIVIIPFHELNLNHDIIAKNLNIFREFWIMKIRIFISGDIYIRRYIYPEIYVCKVTDSHSVVCSVK